ncbi:MAG TPA: RNA polymerase sigma-70 factor [Steroidobacteraceae bacterium]|jgi:RNA polymerase sigma-70 factor (ECF subfamily)|nr:RNA polymerase sigma-70 factor [Steroidobacteraceae bacterium]
MEQAGVSGSPRTAAFEQQRGRLLGIAYRMLGSRAEAEDIVQEAWLRWNSAAAQDIRSPQAWLIAATTRLCIDRLRQLRAAREVYVGPWLPEPLTLEAAPPADHAAELASDLSVAFLAVLERLAPEERAAYLLHEIFDSGYDDIARIIGKSEVASRQIVSRARRRVREARPRVQVSAEARKRLLDGLAQAIRAQDQAALLKLLSEDASWTSDGGGKAKAAKKVIRGAVHVARFSTGVFHRHVSELEFRPMVVNDEPGLAVYWGAQLISLITIRTDGRRILDIYSILNPDKLHGLK